MKSLKQVWAAAQRFPYSVKKAVSAQAAQQPTIETGWICKARIRLQISKGLYIVLSAPAFQ